MWQQQQRPRLGTTTTNQRSVLETDFPLVLPPPPLPPITNPGTSRLSRSSSRDRSSNGFGSLGRVGGGGGGGGGNKATPAPEWQYEAVSTAPRNSGSLRRAIGGDNAEDEDSGGGGERHPLQPKPNGSSSATTTTTSDYYQGGDVNVDQSRLLQHPQGTRHRKTNDGGRGDGDEMSAGTRCCFSFLVFVAQILLHGAVGLVLYWVFLFHRRPGQTWPFAWKEDPKIEFNLHPTLMILGFIYFVGQAMLTYRSCRCCCCGRSRIWIKILHTVFHLAAIPCIAVGFVAVLDSHELRKGDDGLPAPVPNFYSLHSWMGLATMGLFALQFVAGFFSFLLLLCCESATASFRASMVPIHSAFGITTFVMAVATCCSGLTEKAFFTLSVAYAKWVNYVSDRSFSPVNVLAGLEGISDNYTEDQFQESLVINTLGAVLVALVFVMPVILIFPRFRVRPQRVATVVTGHHHHHHHHHNNDRYA